MLSPQSCATLLGHLAPIPKIAQLARRFPERVGQSVVQWGREREHRDRRSGGRDDGGVWRNIIAAGKSSRVCSPNSLNLSALPREARMIGPSCVSVTDGRVRE